MEMTWKQNGADVIIDHPWGRITGKLSQDGKLMTAVHYQKGATGEVIGEPHNLVLKRVDN